MNEILHLQKKAENIWEVYINNGRDKTGKNLLDWVIEIQNRGAGEILLTSIDFDGTLNGYDLKLTRTLSDAVEVPVIASGGVGKPKHMAEGILEGHASAVLAASIFHFGEYSIEEAKKIMQEQGVPVRL